MKKTLGLFLLFTSFTAFAQRSKNNQLQDSVIGWSNTFTALKPSSYPRAFTTYQSKLPGLFVNWVQKSYIPIGALDFTSAIAEPNEADEAQPHGTGTNFNLWAAEWDATGKKIRKQAHSSNPLYIIANYITDAQNIRILSTSSNAVFMRRSADPAKTFKGYPHFEELLKKFNLHEHSHLKNYAIQYYGCEGDMCQPRVAVYLSPNNKLPIRQLTRGQVLDLIEKAIPEETEREKKKLQSTYGHRPVSLAEEVQRFEKDKLPKWKTNIAKLRTKYKNDLQQPAFINNTNGIEMINIFNDDDIFEERSIMYGLFTYEDGILEKSKQDKPLWICIDWMPTSINSSFYARELHRSMVDHFNFDYVYNHFFAAEKNAGKPYTILNPQLQKDNIAAITKKDNLKVPTLKLPAGTHFFDDFAKNKLGDQPLGWYMPNVGEKSSIAIPVGQTGNWLDLRQYKVIPTNLKRPLPENFKMEFEVVVSSFTSTTGGALELIISNKELTSNGEEKTAANPVDIVFEINAGNQKNAHNPTGWIRLKTNYKGMSDKLRYSAELQYNNELNNNNPTATISIIKQGNKVTGFVNNKEIISVDKYKKSIAGINELPTGTRLNTFSFRNTAFNTQNHIYIGKVKITAL